MQFALALELGFVHPDVMLAHMTSRQYAEWIAYYTQDPFGEQRADLRCGILAATVNNRWRGKYEAATSPRDYMPFAGTRQQTPKEIKAALRSVLKQVADGTHRHNKH